MGEGSHIYGKGSRNNAQRTYSEKARQRLKEKGDINHDLTSQQIALLAKEENAIRGKSYENAAVVNKDSVVYRNTGNKDSVNIPYAKSIGNITTHNHPGASLNNRDSIAGRIGTSFSSQDLVHILVGDARGRVATQGYGFNMTRTAKTPVIKTRKEAAAVKRAYSTEYNKTVKRYAEVLAKASRNKEEYARVLDRVHILATHKASQAIAKKYNMRYTRRKAD